MNCKSIQITVSASLIAVAVVDVYCLDVCDSCGHLYRGAFLVCRTLLSAFTFITLHNVLCGKIGCRLGEVVPSLHNSTSGEALRLPVSIKKAAPLGRYAAVELKNILRPNRCW